MRLIFSFGISFFVTFIVGSAIAIFGFDYFEQAWGRWNSLQVYFWLAIPLTALIGVGAWSGARLVKVSLVNLSSKVLLPPAFLFALIANAITWLIAGSALGVGGIALVLTLASSLFVAFWFRSKSSKNVGDQPITQAGLRKKHIFSPYARSDRD